MRVWWGLQQQGAAAAAAAAVSADDPAGASHGSSYEGTNQHLLKEVSSDDGLEGQAGHS